jgi:hypothetical protein
VAVVTVTILTTVDSNAQLSQINSQCHACQCQTLKLHSVSIYAAQEITISTSPSPTNRFKSSAYTVDVLLLTNCFIYTFRTFTFSGTGCFLIIVNGAKRHDRNFETVWRVNGPVSLPTRLKAQVMRFPPTVQTT